MNCSKCGNLIAEGAERCEICGNGTPEESRTRKENVIAGIVGAIIGAVIGGGSIILLSQLGYIASVSGLILAICTLKGYELLGGKLSGKGIVISILLMLITPYLADRIDWAILVMQEWSDMGVTFAEAFGVVPVLIADGAIVSSEYIKNLLMIYGFALLGAFTTVRGVLKK